MCLEWLASSEVNYFFLLPFCLFNPMAEYSQTEKLQAARPHQGYTSLPILSLTTSLDSQPWQKFFFWPNHLRNLIIHHKGPSMPYSANSGSPVPSTQALGTILSAGANLEMRVPRSTWNGSFACKSCKGREIARSKERVFSWFFLTCLFFSVICVGQGDLNMHTRPQNSYFSW